MLSDFYKEKKTDKVWWADRLDEFGEPILGEYLFSFDKKQVFNLFRDYPHALTSEQKKIFDEENPYWKNFFKDRQGSGK